MVSQCVSRLQTEQQVIRGSNNALLCLNVRFLGRVLAQLVSQVVYQLHTTVGYAALISVVYPAGCLSLQHTSLEAQSLCCQSSVS